MHNYGLNEITRTIGLLRPCGRDDGIHVAACTDLPVVECTAMYMTLLNRIDDPRYTTHRLKLLPGCTRRIPSQVNLKPGPAE